MSKNEREGRKETALERDMVLGRILTLGTQSGLGLSRGERVALEIAKLKEGVYGSSHARLKRGNHRRDRGKLERRKEELI